MIAALQVGKEREPEESTEADIHRPESGGNKLEVDSGEERPNAYSGLKIEKERLVERKR